MAAWISESLKMQNFDSYKVRSFCNSFLPIVLVLQLLLAGSALSFDFQNITSLERESSKVLAFCVEDAEDEESKFHQDTWIVVSTDNFYYHSSVTDPYLELFSDLDHSRSPPLS